MSIVTIILFFALAQIPVASFAVLSFGIFFADFVLLATLFFPKLFWALLELKRKAGAVDIATATGIEPNFELKESKDRLDSL